ncbi:MAG: hypothetical protein WBC40_04895 [Halobacteriota archaeon]
MGMKVAVGLTTQFISWFLCEGDSDARTRMGRWSRRVARAHHSAFEAAIWGNRILRNS